MTGLRSMLSNNSHHLVQDYVPPSKVQRGMVGIPGDFSVLEVRVVEITEGIYDLAPKILSMRGLQSLRPPNPPKGLLLDT